MRARPEPFGAWIRVDDETLVAVSKRAARSLGIDGGDLWRDEAPRAPSPPIEVHLAITSRCGAGCKGCYLDATPDGDAPPFDVLVGRLRAIAEAGAFTVAFGGGEPLSRPDLGELARAARSLDLTPVVTTSGIGMTPERALDLRAFAQVNVSYDGEGEAYEAVRGFDGARVAERAMRSLAGASIPFGVNIVLTRTTFTRLDATIARASELGAREAQLLRYKPAGRALSPDYLAARLSPDQIEALPSILEDIAERRSIALRVDCSMIPLLSARPLDPALLARFGVLGCEAAGRLAALRVDGAIAPCSFAPASAASADGAFPWAAWQSDPILEAWRSLHNAEPCQSCSLRDVCRGGCRAVASHINAELGPDPECPRVRAYRKSTDLSQPQPETPFENVPR